MIQAPSLRKDEFFTIFIKHLPTKQMASFEGWVTEFSDQFTSNWNQESVYGRMDPLSTFENTQRKISIGFDIVSDSAEMALDNLNLISRLISFQYPVYNKKSDRTVQNTLQAAPLIQMKWTNLISNANTGEFLTGYLDGVNYSPDVEQGGFIYSSAEQSNLIVGSETERIDNPSIPDIYAAGRRDATGQDVTIEKLKRRVYIPKKVSISLNFTVLHTHLVGWYKNGQTFSFGTEEASGKFPNAAASEYVISKVTAKAPDDPAGDTSDFNWIANEEEVFLGPIE
jgi:hypothetical protein